MYDKNSDNASNVSLGILLFYVLSLYTFYCIAFLITECCNRSKPVRYPNKQNIGASTSVYVDTLRPQHLSRVSEIKTVVIKANYHGGNFAVNIHHVPLSLEDRVARGGDKVKILGIASC